MLLHDNKSTKILYVAIDLKKIKGIRKLIILCIYYKCKMHLEISATCKEIYCLSETYMQAKWFEIFPLGYWCNLSIALK